MPLIRAGLRHAGADLRRPGDFCRRASTRWSSASARRSRDARRRPLCGRQRRLEGYAAACHASGCRNCRRRPAASRRSAVRPEHANLGGRPLRPARNASQPAWPPAWPPPTVISRRMIGAPSQRTSIQAPIASRFGRRLVELHLDPVAGILAGVAPDLRRRIAVDDHQVHQPVEVEIGQRRTPSLARRWRRRPCRRLP